MFDLFLQMSKFTHHYTDSPLDTLASLCTSLVIIILLERIKEIFYQPRNQYVCYVPCSLVIDWVIHNLDVKNPTIYSFLL